MGAAPSSLVILIMECLSDLVMEPSTGPMKTKICVKCKQEKSVADFHRNARSSDGLHSYCKECNKAQALAHIRAEKARKALLRAAKKAAEGSQ